MTPREQAVKGGIASGLARQTPELAEKKAEAIRLHVELDYGIQAIHTRTGINKGRLQVVGYFEFVFAFCWHAGLILGGEINQETSCTARQQNIEAQSTNFG